MSRTLSNSSPLAQLTRVRARTGGWLLVAFCHVLAALSVSCVKLPRHARAAAGTALTTVGQRAPDDAPRRININTATRAELEQLPGIGTGLAARIVEHRARYGPFRRVEHLIIVRGISERRFAALRPFVSAE